MSKMWVLLTFLSTMRVLCGYIDLNTRICGSTHIHASIVAKLLGRWLMPLLQEGSQFLPRPVLRCGAALSAVPERISKRLVYRRLFCAAAQLSEGPLPGWQSGWCSWAEQWCGWHWWRAWPWGGLGARARTSVPVSASKSTASRLASTNRWEVVTGTGRESKGSTVHVATTTDSLTFGCVLVCQSTRKEAKLYIVPVVALVSVQPLYNTYTEKHTFPKGLSFEFTMWVWLVVSIFVLVDVLIDST